MIDLVVDHTYIEALINQNNEKHEIAEKISEHIHDRQKLYLPNHELVIIMNENKEYITESQELFKILYEATKIDFSLTKKKYYESYRKFKTKSKLSFTDYLIIHERRFLSIKLIFYITFLKKNDF